MFTRISPPRGVATRLAIAERSRTHDLALARNDLSNRIGILAATLNVRDDLGDVGLLTHDGDPYSQVERPKHMFIRD